MFSKSRLIFPDVILFSLYCTCKAALPLIWTYWSLRPHQAFWHLFLLPWWAPPVKAIKKKNQSTSNGQEAFEYEDTSETTYMCCPIFFRKSGMPQPGENVKRTPGFWSAFVQWACTAGTCREAYSCFHTFIGAPCIALFLGRMRGVSANLRRAS